MKRPVVVATIGFIIGIIIGLYKQSIVLFLCLIVAIFLIKKRYFRYIKLIFTFKVIVMLILSLLIGFTYIKYKNNQYEQIYNQFEKEDIISLTGIVCSDKEEKEYYNLYKIKIENINKNFYCYINKKEKLNFGDRVKITGKFNKPSSQRNTKGFDYSQYLKTKDIYGIIKVNEIEILEKNKANIILSYINKTRNYIKSKANNIEDEQKRSIYLSLIMGDRSRN